MAINAYLYNCYLFEHSYLNIILILNFFDFLCLHLGESSKQLPHPRVPYQHAGPRLFQEPASIHRRDDVDQGTYPQHSTVVVQKKVNLYLMHVCRSNLWAKSSKYGLVGLL